MTVPQRRRLLPLLTGKVRHANRSLETCRFRCGNACDHEIPNESGNAYVGDIITEAVSTRLPRNVLAERGTGSGMGPKYSTAWCSSA